MAKLRSRQPLSKAQPDLIDLLHDEVIYICQQKYSAVSGLEIDGIICISILDTKEQQVVKIHKTLKSVYADNTLSTAKKSNSYPKIAGILSSPTSGEVVPAPPALASSSSSSNGFGTPALNIAERGEPLNFRNDINKLSELLKASDEASYVNAVVGADNEDEPVTKKSKRKRKPPKRSGAAQEIKNTKAPDADSAYNQNEHVWNGSATFGDLPSEKVITVKEEPVDPEYDETTDQIQPKIVSVQSISQPAATPRETDDGNNNTGESVSNLIENLIDKEIQSRSHSEGPTSMDGNSDTGGLKKAGILEMIDADSVRVKQENTSVDSEYGVAGNNQNSEAESRFRPEDLDQNTYGADVQENVAEWQQQGMNRLVGEAQKDKKMSNMEKQWLYGKTLQSDAENSGSDSGAKNVTIKKALLDKYYSKGSIAHEGLPQERPKQEEDPLGRSWIDMVKDNVSKYQAALMKTVTKVKGGSAADPNVGMVTGGFGTSGKTFSSPSGLLQNTDYLKALLKEKTNICPASGPGISSGSASGNEETEPWRGPGPRARSLPGNVHRSSSERSQSVSPAPIVKIEIDEDVGHAMYANKGIDERTERKLENVNQKPSQQGGRKLESRYPALFNQLQQARGASASNPPDSLVDRLPFISFQELFSQAATSTAQVSSGITVPRMSDSVTMQLLAQAKMNPYPSKERNPDKKKSVWKWKKRHVKPRDDSGQVLSHLPVAPIEQQLELKSFSQPSLGINMSAKKTFSKKRKKGDDDENGDEDYKPYSTSRVRRSMQKFSGEGSGSVKEKTRLGSGEKPRIDFTEVDLSDSDTEDLSEIEQMDQGDQSPIELVSAYCKNNCGQKFVSFAELQLHEEECMGGNSEENNSGMKMETVIPVEGSMADTEAGSISSEADIIPTKEGRILPETEMIPGEASTAGSGITNFKCNLCGLDFNQEYRWHYHMVKVHGISADNTGLFR